MQRYNEEFPAFHQALTVLGAPVNWTVSSVGLLISQIAIKMRIRSTHRIITERV